ncbi:MAG: DUF4179 domain-containing protein [Peptococcales bacterium]
MTKSIEEMLLEKGRAFKNCTAPDEMELCLQKALNHVKPKRKAGLIAVALIFAMLFTYNYDAIAYYGKKLLGYDELMNGAISDLNELGRGQEINKSYTFPNGVKVTLDGIMFDENRLIAFYSIESPEKNIDNFSLFPVVMEGKFKTYHSTSGHGIHNEEKTEIKWLHDFKTPAFYERNLTFKFSLSEKGKFIGEGSIAFKLDRGKAMGYTIKQPLNKTISVDESKVLFNSITASPTMTLVEGTLKLPAETRKNIEISRNHRLNLDYDLLADGIVIPEMGSGLRSSPLGLTFEGRFEPLPRDFQDLKIRLNKLPFSKNTHKLVELNLEGEEINIDVEGNEILLKKLYTRDNASYLTIVTDEDVLLEKVYLLVDGKRISLEKTIFGDHQKHSDGTITYERTLQFLGKGQHYQLLLERLSFTKEYDEIIDIPVNRLSD